LALTILTCVADHQRYIVKNDELRNLIFKLISSKTSNDKLLALTPNMIRFLALKLLNNDQSLTVKIGNILVSSSNRVRILGSASIGLVGAFAFLFNYDNVMAIIYFDITENCGYDCQKYFQQLPKEGPIRLYNDKGQLAIASKDKNFV